MHEPDDDPLVVDDLVVHQRADDREQHPDGGLLHAPPRPVRRASGSCSPRMNSTEAARYAAWMKRSRSLRALSGSRWNIFSMRSVMRKPPTTLIVAARDRDDAEHGGERRLPGARGHDRADERDAGDGVGGRHQGRVQQRRDARDHLIADETGQHEDVQLDRRFGASLLLLASGDGCQGRRRLRRSSGTSVRRWDLVGQREDGAVIGSRDSRNVEDVARRTSGSRGRAACSAG